MKNNFSSTRFRQLMVVTLLLIAGFVNGQWTQTSQTNIFSPVSGTLQDVGDFGYGTDNNGVEYMAYTEFLSGSTSAWDLVRVKKLNATTKEWENFGPTYATTMKGRHPKIAFDSNNDIYIAFIDMVSGGGNNGTNKIIIKKYNSGNSTWNNAFGTVESTTSANVIGVANQSLSNQNNSFDFDFAGTTPLVAINTTTTNAYVFLYNGSSWNSSLSNTANYNGTGFDLAKNGNRVYFFYPNLTNNIQGVYYESGTWTALLGSATFGGSFVPRMITKFYNSDIYIGAIAASPSKFAKLIKYSSGVYTDISSTLFGTSVYGFNFDITPQGDPIAAYCLSSSTPTYSYSALKYNGSSWTTVGCTNFTRGLTDGSILNTTSLDLKALSNTEYFINTPSTNSSIGLSFVYSPPSAPTITSFSPTSGPIASTVTITGSNFLCASGVSFNGTAATTFTVNSATSITATVPTGATTGAIAVTTAGGTATSSSNYTVAGQIVVEYPFNNSLNPSIGSGVATIVSPGTLGTTATLSATTICTDNVYTTGYLQTANATFNNAAFQVDLDFSLPALPAINTTGTLFNLSPNGRPFGVEVDQNGRLSVYCDAPNGGTIKSQTVNPQLSVNTNYSLSAQYVSNSIRLKLDDNLILVMDIPQGMTTPTNRSFVIGDAPSSSRSISVCVDNFRVITNPQQFAFSDQLVVNPTSFSAFNSCINNPSDAQTFTVSGTNLSNNTVLVRCPSQSYELSQNGTTYSIGAIYLTATAGTLNSTTVYIRSISSSTATVLSPSQGRSLSVDIGSSYSIYRQSYALSGTIFALPTISGSNSITIGGTTTLTATTTAAASTPWTSSDASIATVSSSGVVTGVAAGSATITYTNTGGCQATQSITVLPAPTITSFTPSSSGIGLTVTLTGTNFTGATAVSFNGTGATTFSAGTSTSITATVPTGATTGTITVTTPGGTATSATSFTVVPAPTITSFTPSSGASGAIVTLTGTNLTGATSVSFNGTATTNFTVNSATQITVTIPSGATTGTIAVTTAGGTAISATSLSILVPLPSITSLSTNRAEIGSQITITGTNFSTTAANNTVYFGGTKATVNSSTAISLTVTVPKTDIYSKVYVVTGGVQSNALDFHLTQYTGGSLYNTWYSNYFKSPTTQAIGFNPSMDGIVVADIDGDGDNDVLVPSSASSAVKIFINNGTSNIANYTTTTLTTSGTPLDIETNDIDNDGDIDLIISNTSKKVDVYTNSGGSYTLTTTLTATTTNSNIRVKAADTDVDGNADIIVFADGGTNGIQIFKNNGGLTFLSPTTVYTTSLSSNTRVGVADINSDKYPEIFFNSDSSGQISMLQNNSGVINSTPVNLGTVSSGVQYGAIEFIDYENDGDIDVTASWQGTKVFLNNGSGSFSTNFDAPNRSHSFFFDIDADGLNDFIQKDLYYDISGRKAVSSSTFSGVTTFFDVADGTTSYMRIADFNGDNYPDLVYYTNSNLYIAEYQGNISPIITKTGTLTAFTKCSGSPSNAQTFTVSGVNLTANLVVAAYTNLEYSLDGTTYQSTLSLTPTSGAVGTTTIYVRMTAGSTYLSSSNFSLTSTGATTETLAVSGTVNPLPTITLGNFSNAYPNTSSVNMPYTAVANAPTTYSVVAGTNALSGFTPITDASFSGSTGNLPVALPANPVPGTYDFNFTIKNANSCQSIVYTKTLTILPQPAIISSFSPKNIAEGGVLTITGEGFSITTTENSVYIGGIKCSVTAATTTSLTVTIPSGVSHSKILYSNTNSNNTAVSADYLSIKYSWPNNILPNSANFANTQTSIALDSPLFSGNSDRFSIADFENDGKPDVITYTGSPATLRYFKNASVSTNGGFSVSQMTANSLASFSTSGRGGHALLLDIEGDGDLDVLGTVGGYNGSSFFQNNTTSAPLTTTRTYSGTSYTGSPNVIDINKDGKTDIISGYTISSGSGFYTHTNTTAFGSSTFSFNYSTSPSSNATSMIRSFDMDGDFYQDVLSSQTNTIVVRGNMQNGTFSATPTNLSTSITPFDIRIADMNGDGVSDIVYSGGNKIGVLINTSTSGNISTATEFIIQTSNTSTVLGLTLADFNNDGKIDIIASGNSKLSVFLNTTTSSLSFDNELDLGSNMNNLSTIVALDLNGDTYMDIVGSNGSTIQYFVYQIVPVISLSSTNLTAFNTCQGTPSASQSFNVSGSNLTSNITIAAFSGYEYSLDNTTFTSTLSIPFGTGTVTNVPVYVRLAGTFSGTPAGNITLSTTNGNAPTVAVTGTIPPAPYPFDRAVNFSNGGHLTKAAGTSINLTNWTVEAWIYPTAWNYLAGIVSKRDFQFMTNSNGALSVMIERSWSWELTSTANNVLTLNQWQHVAASYDATSKVIKIYVNGALVHTFTRTQFFTPDFNSFDLKIGYNNGQGNGSPNRTFAGNIDEVKVWNTARTDVEVASNFATQLTGNETGLTAYYKFDQGVGGANNTSITSITDLTANANHLTPASSTPVYALNGSTNNILQVGPAILSSPNICLNATATLTHTLSGGTWSSSDASIISIDSSTGAATANAEGSVTITYSFSDNGCNYSSTKVFTVLGLPTITAQPATTTQNICLNGTATALSVTATGPGLTYQWYKNSTASNTGGTSISGATSASYTPLTTTAGDAYYYCIVSGTCTPAVTSDVSGLIKVYAPSVAGTISSSVTSICDSAAAILTLSGNTGTIQWQHLDNSVWTDLSGETSTTYSTPTLTQNTVYRALVTNGTCTSATSAEFMLPVYVLPSAPSTTTTINYCQGATATALTATAISGSNLQWYTVSTGGTASTTAPIPTTTTVGSTVYYVSQKANSGPFIIDNNNVSSYASNISNIGQTFLVPNNIKVNSITLKEAFINNVNASTVLKIYNGFGGTLIATADSPYINSYSGWTSGILFSFTNQNISLTGGQTYYFEIISTSTMYPRYSNAYSDGTGYVNSAPTINDFAFKLDATLNVNPCESTRTAITVNVNALPTISGVQNMNLGGATLQLTGSGTPASTTPWVSSNTTVATISATGEVTAGAGGTSIITYTTASGCSITATIKVTDCTAPFGNALNFDGVNDYAVVDNVGNNANLSFSGTANFTIESWVKRENTNGIAMIFSKYNGNVAGNYWLGIDSTGKPILAREASPWGVTATNALPVNEWHHIAATYDGAQTKIYVDGELDNTTSAPLSINQNVSVIKVNIGAGLASNNPAFLFKGDLDEIRVWNVARTATQIQQTYNTTLQGNEALLVAYYDFNQGLPGGDNTAVSSVVNTVNSASNGTLTNFARAGTTSNFVGSGIANLAIAGLDNVCANSTSQFTHPIAGGTWSVSNGAAATVSASGLVTTIGAENITLTYVYTLNGCSFTVNKAIEVQLPTITGAQAMNIGGATVTLTATTTAATTNPWVSSNVIVASVSNTGVVTALSEGTTTITFTNNVGCTATASITVTDCRSVLGNALNFDGANDYVSIGDNIENLADVTMEAWVYWRGSSNPFSEIFTKDVISAFAITNTNKLHTNFGNGFGWDTGLNSTTSIPLNAWTHVAITRQSGVVKMFINGTEDASSATMNFTGQNSSPRVIGGKVAGSTIVNGSLFNGVIDEIRFWSVAKTQTEINASRYNELAGNETSLVAYYNFNQGIASGNNASITALNAVAGGFNGTFNNMPLTTGATSNFILNDSTIAITGSATVCNGSTTQFSHPVSGGAWSVATGSSATIDASGTITTVAIGNSTINYNYTLNGCSFSVTKQITVNELPAITVQPATTSQNICINGSSSPLSVTATGSGISYQWYKNTTNANTGGTLISGAITSSYTPITTVAGGFYYYCIVSGTCTPAATSNVSGLINVSPTSVAGTISGTSSICSGTTTTLTLAGNVGILQWQRFDSPIWTDLTGETNTTFTTPALTQNTTYRAMVISGSCTSVSTAPFNITVNPLPVISGTTTVGIGDTITLVKTTTAATTNPWISSSPTVATISNTGVVSGLISGTTTITFTNNNGCTDTETITVITGTTQTPILTLPATNTTGATTLNFNYTLPETPLAGSVTLIFTPTAGGTPILWSMNNTTSAVFSYVVGTNPTTIANVVSGTALGFTTYNVTIAYQDAFANPTATATNSNIQTLAPPAISFANANYNGVINVPISIPTVNTGGAMETYSILPNLPAGMTLDTATGLISGTPTVTLVQTTFTITATNAAGTDSETITLFIDVDTDGDGIGNANDPDIDNDGTPNAQDTNPLDWCQGFTPSTASTTWTAADCDNDGIANGSDVDVDGNGTNDNGTDTDNDGINDTNDTDIDGDGIPNGSDADPDGNGTINNGPDMDGDGINDAHDTDMDGDGIPNGADSDPDGNGTINNGLDTDGDGINDANDPDIDGDGIPNGTDGDANGDGITDTGVVDTDGDGITDAADSDPNGDGIIENGPDTDGDGINNANDTDIDGDGIPNNADVDPDGDGINNNGTDNDHDGINDANDPDIDGDGIPNNADVDVNGDGINDNGTDTDNDGINNANDSDIDGDGVPNAADADPDGDGTMNNGPDTDGDGINDTADSDVNGDGIDDNGTDTDNDGINDANDTDIDGDGIPNGSDADPDGNGTINNGPDMDGDGINDAHDTDMDGDGIPNGADSDPDGNGTINNGLDTDGDGINDANDPDIDGDGIPNGTDGDANGDGITDTGVVDTDGDGITDAADSDPNGDGIIDNGPDTDGDGINDANDTDMDGDGIPNTSDADPDGNGTVNNGTDTDGDGINDANDPDIDGDGIPNAADADVNGDGIDDNGTDTDNDGINNSNDADIDGDGIPNVADADPDGDGTINNGPDTDGDGINDTADSDVNGDGVDDNGTDTDNDGINDANDPDLDGDGIPNGDDADPDGNGTINNGPDMDGDGINDANDTDMDGDGIPNGVDNCPNVVNPSITLQPNNQVVDVCPNTTPPTLTIQAVGEQLTYQWYSNTANSNIGGTILVGATNASYVPSNTLVGPRYYYVVINGTCGSEKSNVSGAITIQDLTLPTVLTQNISVALNAAGTASITAAQINNGSTDNCSIASVVVSPTNFTCANIGANTVTLTVTDVNGNVNTGTATVTVTETTLPTVLTQNISVALNAAGTASITAAQINNGSTDNCSIATVVVSPTTFTCANIGANTVTLTVTDVNGNVSTGTATVTVTDTTLPTVLTLNISVALNAVGTASITAAQINNGSTDNCSIATVVVSPSTFTCANIGANTVTLTVTDANGNVNTGTATVTVTETILPIVVTQNFTAALNATGSASITAAQINNGSTDNCSIATVVVSPSTFTCANIGANTVTLTVTDVNGNVNTGTATVTVVDATLPTVVTQNASIILDAVGQGSITAAQINNGSTDNCGIATVTVSQLNFSCTNIGTNTVTLTVTDVNGNSNTGTAIVTVINNFVDTDGDGIKDNCDDDDDNDGESDVEENQNGTDPLNPCSFKNIPSITSPAWSHWSMLDCDNDGLTNGEEIGPDPNNPFDPNNNTIPDYIDPNNHATSDDGLEIFNLVTPNGDGENDVFVIRNIGLYPENSVEVYNRWGSKVYSIDGYGQNQNYFRGVSEGKVTVGQDAELPVGTYWYVLNYKNTQGVWIQRVGYLYLNK
ncbi:MAG: LamG-like jellyroll fold domain-containing protein [Flavobacterium sp.]